MHNPSTPPPPPPPPPPDTESISVQLLNDELSSSWDWSDFINFDQFSGVTNRPLSHDPCHLTPTAAATTQLISCGTEYVGPTPAQYAEEEEEGDTAVRGLSPTKSELHEILGPTGVKQLPGIPPPGNLEKVRKRDPRITCSNFLAGIIPCACPEMDAMIAEEEAAGPGKKRARTGGACLCQVPGCGSDISELKGYHRRHRVCLRCATASNVVVDGENKRYCQQCGKFHIMSDFDEGKRSCRRKLERHNNRRRRKSTNSKKLLEQELEQALSAEDIGRADEIGKDTVCLNNKTTEIEKLLDSERHSVPLCSISGAHDIQSNSGGASLGVSGETQCDEEKEKCTQSTSYGDKSVFFSACPTDRISFKLYDWNPAEFPRRLRHQIFQWLASMPVELEGYIRPGCTILTVFVAMPKLMWAKFSEDPLLYIRDLVAPGNMLSGRGTFYVYLNNMIFHVRKDGTFTSSVVKVQVKKQAPKLHYIHPTCFEVGKPMEFVVCGKNLLQPKFRFLLSFAGEYLAYDICVLPFLNKTGEEATSGDHQLLKICVPRTELCLSGPAFVEEHHKRSTAACESAMLINFQGVSLLGALLHVENESGLSNFIPILIGDTEICSEMNIVHHKLDTSLHSRESQFAANISSCEISESRQKHFSDILLDVAWLLKEPDLENKQQTLASFEIQRFNYLLNFLIENELSATLERVAYHVKIITNKKLTSNVTDADMKLYHRNIEHVNDMLYKKLKGKVNSVLHIRGLVSEGKDFDQSSKIDLFPDFPATNQDKVIEKMKSSGSVAFTSDRSGTVRLLISESAPNMNLITAPRKASSLLFTNKVLPTRPLIFIISAAAAVCLGVCAVVLHPHKAGEIVVSIRRCLFDNS